LRRDFFKMECREYIEIYLAAHADGELDPAERRAADAHIDGCEGCRALLADERALKALIRDRLRKAPLPAGMRAAIRVALDRAEAPQSIRERLVSSPHLSARSLRAASVGLTAIAATIVFALLMHGWSNRRVPASDLDMVVAAFTASEQHFAPNPLCVSYGGVAEHYHSARMPAFIWNFEPFGFHLIGGRIDKLADGRPATLTLYRSANGAIMCIRFHAPDFKVPPGAHPMPGGSYAYSYQGCSLVISADKKWVCVLISNLPAPQFEKDVAFLES